MALYKLSRSLGDAVLPVVAEGEPAAAAAIADAWLEALGWLLHV